MDTTLFEKLKKILNERILVLDGAMGSLIQCHCSESSRHHDHSGMIPDIMVRDNPELVKMIHIQYLEAGADIIETDSFNCNRFSLSDYGLENEVYSLSRKSAKIAREAINEYQKRHHGAEKFVAGSVGPTKYMLSLAEENSDINFDAFVDTYTEQIRGLLDGGADIILLETVFDTLTLKTALYAISSLEEERGIKIPVMISATLTNSTGRLLSGQSIEAFYASVSHIDPLSVGINCGFGSGDVLTYMERLSEVAETAVSVYPNAGMPDNCGEYSEDAGTFARNLTKCLEKGLVNIVGGCCGTTPDHIKALKKIVGNYPPRVIPHKKHILVLSNLDYSVPGSSKEVVQIGERTNVAGSAKFARLVREKKFDDALEIAVKQVENGAGILDICMDDGLEDAVRNMNRFLSLVNSNPETGRVPVMIDSSNWDVIVSALKRCQGKGIVNSISLKDGEDEFVKRAKEIHRLGAAVVVMLFDEEGQAETFEHKCRVASRSYKLLIEIGIGPENIIFDPNVLTVGSGLKEEDLTSLDFIRATAWIRENLPFVSVSGGISNLSFAFRGNNSLRKAMHTVFIYHAVKAGMNMAIVNPGMLSLYEDIDPVLLNLIEDLLLWRRNDAVRRLLSYAEKMNSEQDGKQTESDLGKKELSLEEKLAEALFKGKENNIETLTNEALIGRKPMEVIDQLLMPVMKKIGERFGEGKMFLPQVIKSAQVMKKIVSSLQPFIDGTGEGLNSEKVIIATVKGDVHDIGKNIVSLVVSCNGYDVVDLGVRVDAKTIADKVAELNPKALLLSGLISPSLNEMVKVCEELESRGLCLPVIIGGAATSEMHTAIKIAPVYSGDVYYSSDASANLRILTSLSQDFSESNRKRQDELRIKYLQSKEETGQSVQTAKAKGTECVKNYPLRINPKSLEREIIVNTTVSHVEKYIDWDWLASSLELERGKSKDADNTKVKSDLLSQARDLLEEIKRNNSLRLEGVVRTFEVNSDKDDIIINLDSKKYLLPMLRAERGTDAGRCVTDYISSEKDYLALFALTGGIGLEDLSLQYKNQNDFYSSFIVKLLADRITEAFAQWLHHHVSTNHWNQPDAEPIGCRIAFGYPAAPDHSLKRDVFNLLGVTENTVMGLTENYMITPPESICGMILPKGEYINVGKIGKTQLIEYSRKRGITLEELSNLIPNNIF